MQLLKVVIVLTVICCTVELTSAEYSWAQFWHDLWNPKEEEFVWNLSKDPCDRNCRGACIEKFGNSNYYMSFCNDDGWCICKKPKGSW